MWGDYLQVEGKVTQTLASPEHRIQNSCDRSACIGSRWYTLEICRQAQALLLPTHASGVLMIIQ